MQTLTKKPGGVTPVGTNQAWGVRFSVVPCVLCVEIPRHWIVASACVRMCSNTRKMNPMNDVIRPQAPIRCRPHRVLIPSRSFEPRPPRRAKPSAGTAPCLETKYPCKCGGLNVPVRAKLVQRCRIRGSRPNFKSRGSSQTSIGSANGPVEKNAMPNRANAMPGNLRPNRIRNPRPKTTIPSAVESPQTPPPHSKLSPTVRSPQSPSAPQTLAAAAPRARSIPNVAGTIKITIDSIAGVCFGRQ